MIMKLEEQVTSLELSKRLKELGVKQESFFKWQRRESPYTDGWALGSGHLGDYAVAESYSAYTVSEISEMLNTELTDVSESDSFTLKISSDMDFWYVNYGNGETESHTTDDRSLADALAKQMIYLLENNLLKA
jgi:hypothetical protein